MLFDVIRATRIAKFGARKTIRVEVLRTVAQVCPSAESPGPIARMMIAWNCSSAKRAKATSVRKFVLASSSLTWLRRRAAHPESIWDVEDAELLTTARSCRKFRRV